MPYFESFAPAGFASTILIHALRGDRDQWIRVIALFKLVKAVLLVVVGVGVLKLLHRDVGQVIEHWINLLQLDPDNQHIQNLLLKLWLVDDRKLKEIGAGTFCYAALFLTEGTGLLLRKRWAQYFTIIVTASFLPFEISLGN